MFNFHDSSWREKTTSVYLLSQAICFVPYFIYLSQQQDTQLPVLQQILGYGITAVSQLLILGCGYLWLRRRFADEARQQPDERDLLIEQQATRVAYGVLMAGTILVGCIMPFADPPQRIFQSAVFFLVLSEATRNIIVLRAYRQGRAA